MAVKKFKNEKAPFKWKQYKGEIIYGWFGGIVVTHYPMLT
jgi:hypothetical protein